jgi:hypothetical protein
VASGKRALGDMQNGMNPDQGDLGAQQPRALDGAVIRAPGVDALEETRMPGSDRGSPAKVLAANVDELGVDGEGGSERRSIHEVPGSLELADNLLERGSLGWREIDRHAVLPVQASDGRGETGRIGCRYDDVVVRSSGAA